MRRLLAGSLLVLAAWVSPVLAQHQHVMAGDNYGSVHFRTSCSAAVQPDFERAVAMLHSFVYERANAAFTDIARRDPKCAMAWWGVAMTQYHGLWEQIWPAEGRAAVEKARAAAQANASVTPRERQYIEAIARIYDDASTPLPQRELSYEQAMAKLHADFPDDTEATIFYALALDVTAPKDDKTYANQRKARDLLTPLFVAQPNHPGLAHYIIHVSDYPPLAQGALDAARRYAKIAPSSAHAEHMPSHIFTRLGLWDESIQSNLASAASAERDQKELHTDEAYNQRLHALDYLEYAYLQLGKFDEARAVLEQTRAIRGTKKLSNVGSYAEAAIPARYALERQDWKAAAALEPGPGSPANSAITWFAKGLGAAMTNDTAAATHAVTQLAAYRDQLQDKDKYWSAQIEIQRLQVQAWNEFKSGNTESGLAKARAAADLEDSMSKSPVTPGPVLPAREGLARMLLAAGQKQEAAQQFDAVLKVAPNRWNAMEGARQAATVSSAKTQ